ncbi:MAG: hypothetical protein BV457_00155 [Thermoplasmata archaeon M9B1D]|nr:MAG: hypothetical protein BV457_00155 [Thermoplasmata archaeon M9B1D]PNX52223.1 MAG: hypothetical protein BV456_00140 [Thermoplasmata archaeon M8B2D]
MSKDKTGASDGGDSANIKNETEDKKQGGDNKNTETLEELKKVKAGQDKKISELLEQNQKVLEQNKVLSETLQDIKTEQEKKALEGKTAKEQNEILQNKVKLYEKKEVFRKAFENCELNANEWEEIVDCQNFSKMATKIKEIFDREKEKYSNSKLEEFKLTKLKEVDKNTPDPKNPKDEKNLNLDIAKKLKNN